MTTEELKQDMARLRRHLGRALDAAGATFSPANRGAERHADQLPTGILDLACGACHEGGVLADVVADRHRGDPQTAGIELVGMDVRGREIAEARSQWSAPPEATSSSILPADASTIPSDYLFLEGDATKLDGHKELRERFDMVFLRHQNFYHGEKIWRSIFDQGLERLENDGLLVITSYFAEEHHLAVNALKAQGAELLVDHHNQEARKLGYRDKAVDQRIAVFRKKG